MGFSRQEYWSGYPFPSPGDFPDPGTELASLTLLTLAGTFFTTSTTCRGEYSSKKRKYNSNSTLGYVPHRTESRVVKCYLYTPFTAILSTKTKVGSNTCAHWGMNRKTMWKTYNGILFNLKNKGNSDTWYNIDEPWRHFAKWNVSHRNTNTMRYHLCEVPRVVKFIEIERRMVIVRNWQNRGMGNYCLMGTEFQFARWKELWQLVYNNVNTGLPPWSPAKNLPAM